MAGPPFRVATYNVHAHVGRDGRRDPERVSSVIADLNADVVALQEFTYPLHVELETRIPVVLTTLESYTCALGPARQTSTHCFGNAILTRHTLVDVERIDLSSGRREPRGALAATIEFGDQRIHVLAAHLGLRVPERRMQVQRILDYLDTVTHTNLVVLGDFNDWMPGRTVAEAIDDRLGRFPRVRSFPSRRPIFALDRIWVQPKDRLTRTYAHDTPASRRASDHLPVVAEIEW